MGDSEDDSEDDSEGDSEGDSDAGSGPETEDPKARSRDTPSSLLLTAGSAGGLGTAGRR